MENLKPQMDTDAVVYTASLGGILTALVLRERGYRPLIMNHAGFPGGAITETLACVQSLPSYPLGGLSPQPLDHLLNKTFQPLAEAGTVFVDAETWKRMLWKLIRDLELPALFHVTPYAVTEGEAGLNLHYMAREGRCKLPVRLLVDCSSSHDLIAPSRSITRLSVHALSSDLPSGSRIPGTEVRAVGTRHWLRKYLRSDQTAQSGLALDKGLEELSTQVSARGGNLQQVPMRALELSSGNPPSHKRMINPWVRGLETSDDILQQELEMSAYVHSLL